MQNTFSRDTAQGSELTSKVLWCYSSLKCSTEPAASLEDIIFDPNILGQWDILKVHRKPQSPVSLSEKQTVL